MTVKDGGSSVVLLELISVETEHKFTISYSFDETM